MNRRQVILPIVILLGAIIATATMIKLRKPVATVAPVDHAPLIRTVTVAPADYPLVIEAHGTVEPRTSTSLVAEVSGAVEAVSPKFVAGGFFKKGEEMLHVDDTNYAAAVAAANSAVAQARVRAELERANSKVAREEWKDLGDGGDAPLATRKLQLQEAEAALDAAEAALRKAQRDLDRTRVRAPYDCRVRSKSADRGQYLIPGAPVARIYATDVVEVRLPVPDTELQYLQLPQGYDNGGIAAEEGPHVVLLADFAGEQREWEGTIVRTEGEIDPATRMINVVAAVTDPYGEGRDGDVAMEIGLFVKAEIEGRVVPGAVTLPRAALRNDGNVLVVDNESRLRFRKVDVVRADRDTLVISGGLAAGERVCVSVLDAVTDGMRVRVAGEPEQSQATDSTTTTAGGSR